MRRLEEKGVFKKSDSEYNYWGSPSTINFLR